MTMYFPDGTWQWGRGEDETAQEQVQWKTREGGLFKFQLAKARVCNWTDRLLFDRNAAEYRILHPGACLEIG